MEMLKKRNHYQEFLTWISLQVKGIYLELSISQRMKLHSMANMNTTKQNNLPEPPCKKEYAQHPLILVFSFSVQCLLRSSEDIKDLLIWDYFYSESITSLYTLTYRMISSFFLGEKRWRCSLYPFLQHVSSPLAICCADCCVGWCWWR